MKKYIKASIADESTVVVDFVYDDSYDKSAIEDAAADAINSSGEKYLFSDFESLDSYDDPEYAGEHIARCYIDFEYTIEYDKERIKWYLYDRIEALGYEIADIAFGRFI